MTVNEEAPVPDLHQVYRHPGQAGMDESSHLSSAVFYPSANHSNFGDNFAKIEQDDDNNTHTQTKCSLSMLNPDAESFQPQKYEQAGLHYLPKVTNPIFKVIHTDRDSHCPSALAQNPLSGENTECFPTDDLLSQKSHSQSYCSLNPAYPPLYQPTMQQNWGVETDVKNAQF